jgi:hypothetical protein
MLHSHTNSSGNGPKCGMDSVYATATTLLNMEYLYNRTGTGSIEGLMGNLTMAWRIPTTIFLLAIVTLLSLYWGG